MAGVDDIRTHFVRRLRAAELVMRPFPHLLLTDALPSDVYEAATSADPFAGDPGAPFGDPAWTSKLRFPQFYDRRFQHDLGRSSRTLHCEPWRTIGDAFSDPAWLGPVLRDRFPEYFELRFGHIDAIEMAATGDGFWTRLHTRAFLQRHEQGYRLDAHTDIPSRVATCIFGFPPGPGYEEAGTKLLEPLDPTWRCSGNSHYPVEDFRVVSTAPYAPNTCLVFFKTRHSWHSVSPEAASVPGGRLGMQVQLYEPDGGAVFDLSDPDLVRNRQFIEPSRLRSLAARLRSKVGSTMRSNSSTKRAD